MIHIFFVRMYHHIKQLMCVLTQPWHTQTLSNSNNYSQKKHRRNYEKMLFSKHINFNPSVFGFRGNNSSPPSGTSLTSSRFVLAICINFMGYLLFVCLFEFVCLFCRGWDLIYKLCQVTV